MKKFLFVWQLPVVAMVASLNSAHAGGFSTIEIGASGLGNAYAGAAAVAADTSTVWFNPAGMLELGQREFSAALHVLDVDTTFSNRGTNLSSLLGGGPVSGPDFEDIGQTVVLPNLFYMQQISDRLAFGFGVTVPFGSSTEYDRDWVGRYSSIESGVNVIDFNPTVAYRVSDRVSVGGGISVQYMTATLSSAIDGGATCLGLAATGNTPLQRSDCLNAGLVPGNQATDSVAEIEGDSVEVTFNVSALFQLQQATRLGVAYRHGADHSLDGDADFTVNPGLAGVLESAGLSLLQDGGGTAGADLPAQLMLSVVHDANRRLQLLADATWTGWSSLEEIRIVFDNPAQPDSPTPLNWENVWRLSAGANYRLNDAWTLRAGVAFDEEPIPSSSFRSPRIPGSDRTWLSVGAGYRFSKHASVDVGFTHVMLDETPVSNDVLDQTGAPTTRGLYDSSVNILGAQLSLRF